MEPKTVDYLNFDSTQKVLPASLGNVLFSISKRIVYDTFMMFGDVGGSYDFFSYGLFAAFGFLSETYYRSALINSLFHINTA